MIKFLADMDISPQTTRVLQEKGYDAKHLRSLNLHRAKDTEIIQLARDEERVILTMDLDFGTILALSGESSPGIIIFRLKLPKPQWVNTLMLQLLTTVSEEQIRNSIVIVEENKIRFHKLPAGE